MASRFLVWLVFVLAWTTQFQIEVALSDVPGFNQQVETPQLEPAKRGSLVGELSSFAQDGDDLMKGSFRLALPMHFPEERGKLLFPVVPSYSMTRGISEWGLGFEAGLSITRYRRQGNIQYTEDEYVSPWGTLLKGTDGFYYPEGMQSPIRLAHTDEDSWVAYLEDGTRLLFGGKTARIVTQRGTYAWYLTLAESVLNERSVYSYKEVNAGDYPVLERVTYGGKGTHSQYEIRFLSSSLNRPFFDYLSGEKTTRRYRIEQVKLSVLNKDKFQERFSYFFRYKESNQSPSFYLAEMKKRYASGSEDPPFILEYNDPEAYLKSAKWVPTEQFNSLLSSFPNALVPERHSVLSLEDDGQGDLELANSHARVKIQNGSPEVVRLSDPDDQVDIYCRPDPKTWPPIPRVHARLKGVLKPLEVVGFEVRNRLPPETFLHVCDFEGRLKEKVKIEGYSLKPGNIAKLADLSNKGKPDLVWVGKGNATSRDNKFGSEIRLKIFENISTDDTVAFRDPIEVKLDGILASDSFSMFQDINGDGILDFVLVQSSGISVWYGKGNLQFEKDYAFFPFNVGGTVATKLFKSRVNFHDLNGDGLPEAIVLTETGASIFLQQGSEFVLQLEGPLTGRSWAGHSGRPIVFDLLGTGNVQIAAQDLVKNHVNIIELSEPGTGLLKKVDDGKGTQIEYSYKRVISSPGIRNRFPIVAKTTVSISGEGSKSYRYEFADPEYHSRDGGFLGFKKMTTVTETGQTGFQFQYGDTQPGVLLSKTELDFRIPNLMKVLQQGYLPAEAFGISWLRKSAIEEGFQDVASIDSQNPSSKRLRAAQSTLFDFDDHPICPSKVETRSKSSSSHHEIRYFDSNEFKLSLHCLLESFQVIGVHPQKERDFKKGVKVKRNNKGQPIQIVRLADMPKTLQNIEYDENGRIRTIEVPGKGKTLFNYDSETGLLSSLLSPDNVTYVSRRDPIHDQIKELKEAHGGTDSYQQSFEFDLSERLSHSFGQVTSSPSILGEVSYGYAFAKLFEPGWIEEQRKIEESSGKGILKKTMYLMSARGTDLGTFIKVGDSGVLSGLKRMQLDEGTASDLAAKVLDYNTLKKGLDYTALYQGAPTLHELTKSRFAFNLKETHLHQLGTRGVKEFNYPLGSEQVVQEMKENSTISWFQELDHQRKITTRIFPNKSTYQYNYDALGRVVQVALPSGEKIDVTYNEYGDLHRLSRTGLGSIRFSYHPTTSLLEKKEYLDNKGTLVRSTHFDYDNQGRTKTLTYRDAATKKEDLFRYYHDGTAPDGTLLPGQNGRLSAVAGPGFQKKWNYREDGKVLTEKWTIEGLGALLIEYRYFSDGALKEKRIERLDMDGKSKFTVNFASTLDENGRESKKMVDDLVLYTLGYDSLSRLSSVSGSTVNIEYEFDDQTQRLKGFKQKLLEAQFYSTFWEFDSRGNILREKFSSSKKEEVRSYQYSDEGYLSTYENGNEKTQYLYDQHQWLSQVDQGTETYPINSTSDQWQTKNESYALDSSGRVTLRKTEKQQMSLFYGPQGRVVKVVRLPLAEVTYLYDDEGKRIAKMRGDRVEEAYIGNAILTPGAFLQPIDVNGNVFGYLENNVFQPLSPDLRNTIAMGDNHELQVPGPYGEREDRKNSQSISLIDYAFLGYDDDLKAYRAEQRDYDPNIKRFLTPDPLFLENPEKCIESPVECNLYSYSQNNPVNFVDPTGKVFQVPAALGGALAGGIFGVAKEIYTNPDWNKMTFMGAAVGGAVSGAAAGASLGVGLALGVGGNLLEQGVKMIDGKQKSINKTEVMLSAIGGYAASKLTGLFLGNFSNGLTQTTTFFQEAQSASQTLALKSFGNAEIYRTSIVQIEGMFQKEMTNAAMHQSISEIAGRAAFRSGFLSGAFTTGTESVVGIPVGNLLEGATPK